MNNNNNNTIHKMNNSAKFANTMLYSFTKTLVITPLLFFGTVFSLYAQQDTSGNKNEITMEQTFKYINSKLSGRYEVKFGTKMVNEDQNMLILYCYDNGKKIREDRVFIEALDYKSVRYRTEDGMVIIGCKSDKGDCVDKKLPGEKIHRTSRHLSLVVPDPKSGASITEAFTHMIMLVQEFGYKRTQPFE